MTPLRGVVAVAFALAAPVGIAAASARSPQAVVEEARGLALVGDRIGARAVLDSLLAAEGAVPEDLRAEAAYLRADLEENGEDLERRLRFLLTTEHPRLLDAELRLQLGRLRFARGDFLQAMELFAHARADGREEEGSLWEGLSATALGDLSRADAALRRAAQSGNARIRQRACMALGDVHRGNANWEEAASWYGRLEDEQEPGPGWWAAATYRRGECLESLGRPEEAQDVWGTLLRRAPDAYEAPLARGRLLAAPAEAALSPEEPVPGGRDSTAVAASADRAFAVQLGAFAREENAREMADRLRDLGFVPRISRSGEGLYRVLVGRLADRVAAEALADSIVAAFPSGYSILPLEGGPGSP